MEINRVWSDGIRENAFHGGNSENRGIYHRATRMVFEATHELRHFYDFYVLMQMVEVYNEEVYDLLGASVCPSMSSQEQQPIADIRQENGRMYLQHRTTLEVTHADEVLEGIERGTANRHRHTTNTNEHSSRFHRYTGVSSKYRF